MTPFPLLLQVDPVSLDPLSLFLQASLMVKLTMLVLGLASVWSWAVIIEKYFTIARTRTRCTRFEQVFWSGGSLEQLYDTISDRPTDPMQAIFVAAMREWRRFVQSKREGVEQNLRISFQQRVERAMELAVNREMERIERQMVVLATVSSASPFIGLFGTVWGIMNSFSSIAVSGNTNLTAVAPGIAEALFATALGLLAAIPATIFYNLLSTRIGQIEQRLESFAGEFAAIISRQLERS